MASGSLLLKPENARFFDLFTILFSRNLIGSKLVEISESAEVESAVLESAEGEGEGAEKIPESRKDSFLPRQPKRKYSSILGTLVIRFSLLVQVFLLLFVTKSIKRCLKFLLGQENDKEVLKFDIDIKPDDDRKYNAALTAMACEASYKTIDCIKTAVEGNPEMEFVDSYGFSEETSRGTTDAFVFQDKRTNTYVVVFRGTERFNVYEWCADFDISRDSFLEGKVHRGFWNLSQNAYYVIRNILREALKKNNDAKLIITGHSLGGALAILFTAKLLLHNDTDLLERLHEVHTFGQPRVGNKKFANYMESKLRDHHIIYYRVVYRMDMVPRLPFDINDGLFKHIGPSIQYNRENNYEIYDQLPYNNYYAPLMAIPLRLAALFELIMNFTKKEEDRKNLRSMIPSLISPGIADHFVNNYANATKKSFPRGADELKKPKMPSQTNVNFLIYFGVIFFLCRSFWIYLFEKI